MKTIRIALDSSYYGKGVGRKLRSLIPFLHKEKEYRDFYILRPTDLVRKRIFRIFIQIVEGASEDARKAMQDRKFLYKNIFTLIPELALYVDSLGLLGRLCAAVICPVGQTIDTKNDDEICDYLDRNADLQQEVQILSGFFFLAGVPQIIAIVLSIKSEIGRKLTTK